MFKRWALMLVLMVSASSFAQEIERIEVGLAFGLSGFNASNPIGNSTLSWTGNNVGFYLYTDGGKEFIPAATDIVTSFTTMTDNSAGGVAAAFFDTGTFSITSYNAGSMVLQLCGTLDWYDEAESADDALFGKGIVTVDTCFIDPVFFEGAEWAYNPAYANKSGVNVTTVDITPEGLENYQSDFTSNNVTFVIYADPTQIPEPMTMSLLALGALGFLRRR